MADPLSLAASAAGLLSLGIQVTGGISKYLDALKCRREDLEAVRRKNDALQHIIASVKSTVSSPQPLSRSHAAVADCIATCEGELAGLETLVAQLAGCKDAQTWKARLQDRSRKLSYPFKQSKVQQLSQRLDQANGTLQIALEGLGLQIAQRSEQTLERVVTSINGFSVDFHSVRSEVASIRHYTKESNLLQRDHYDRVESHLAMYTTSLSTIVHTTQKHNTALISQNSELIAEIGNLRKLLATQEMSSTSQAESRVTPAQAVFRIARSPPSQLKKLCDNLGGHDSINFASSETDHLVCLCTGAVPKAKRGSAQWGFLLLYHEGSSRAHQSHCPWAKRTERLGLGFSGLPRFLKVAIEVSFTLSSGAGGWSLSQNFTYHPTVDSETDPVFQAVESFVRSRRLYFFDEDNRKKEDDKVTKLLQEIKQIYTEGRSTPNAVDSQNNTPLHQFFLMDGGQAFNVRSWDVIYKTLRSLGVPATSCNLAGLTWLSYLPESLFYLHWDQQSTLALSTIVRSEFSGIPVNTQAPRIGSIVRWIDCLEKSPFLAGAYGCGPLSLAVLANDSEEVERLLANHSNCLLEKNSVGQTALHLAANKPSCLRLLVRASTPSLLNQRDGQGTTPLEYAMSFSFMRCVNYSRRDKCSRCNCAECVAILLKADCEVPLNNKANSACFENASERSRRRFVSHFQNRRQRLLQLAQSNHSIISKDGLPLGADGLPDAKAPLIIDSLRANNIIVPQALDVRVPSHMFRSIFQVLRTPSSATQFFQKGFRDIDPIVNGETPLTVSRLKEGAPEYLLWLMDNGADVFRLIVPSRQTSDTTGARGIFAAHCILYSMGDWLTHRNIFWHDENKSGHTSNLISRTLPSNVRDGCTCACSNESCTPLVYLLKGIMSSRFECFRLLKHSDIIEHRAELVVQMFEALDDALAVQLQLSSIRWITFEALELSHTCCNAEEVLDPYDRPKAIEIADLSLEGEDPEVLKVFEEMVEELLEAAKNTYAATSSLVYFWTKIWASRVTKEMEKLRGNSLSEKERDDSEAIGVNWHQQPQPKKQPTGDFTGNPYRWGTRESVHWKARQLDPTWYSWLLPREPRASAFRTV